MNADFKNMVRCAAKAPSGHNTQPWKFRVGADSITILPDWKCCLPIVDSDNRELFISLGCAAENLCIAARQYGYAADISEHGNEGITVGLTKCPGIACDSLFEGIDKRQTNRSIYNGKQISGEVLCRLQSVRCEDNINIYIYKIGSQQADSITEYILKGNQIQMNDRAFRDELLSWMRFNRAQVETKQDGLSYDVFGNPPLPAAIARHIVSRFLKPGIQNKSDKRKIYSSSHFVLFTIRHNTVVEWIDLGLTLQRLLLEASRNDIACAFMNQPCEIDLLASELGKTLGLINEYPALILRTGYAEALPYSPRKGIDSILL